MQDEAERLEIEDKLFREGVAEGFASIEAGQFVEHERVMAWLADLAAGNYRPPPKPER